MNTSTKGEPAASVKETRFSLVAILHDLSYGPRLLVRIHVFVQGFVPIGIKGLTGLAELDQTVAFESLQKPPFRHGDAFVQIVQDVVRFLLIDPSVFRHSFHGACEIVGNVQQTLGERFDRVELPVFHIPFGNGAGIFLFG